MKKTWSIVVIYEDAATRENAVRVCDHLVKRFWAEGELDVNWWSCAMLEEPVQACQGVEKAVQADLIILSLRRDRELASSVSEWIEGWLAQRGEREGALVDLTGQDVEAGGAAAERHIYLRHAAHRGWMDYLTREPETISWSMPDSPESVTARADRVTSVLDEILHTQPTPHTPSLVSAISN